MLDILKNGKGEVLNLLFKDPEKEYYLGEIANILGKKPGQYQKILNDLVEEGILADERKGNLRFFKLNKNYVLYEEIKKIISKTIGLEFKLKEVLDEFTNIKYAFVFGSIAKNKENGQSDIDLMLIGEADQDNLTRKLSITEDEIDRAINHHLFTEKDILEKINEKDFFITEIFEEPKIAIKGNLNKLARPKTI
ncbi:nucleotidyltransferase domain-containing protein [Patescibacteria group bacterium]